MLVFICMRVEKKAWLHLYTHICTAKLYLYMQRVSVYDERRPINELEDHIWTDCLVL